MAQKMRKQGILKKWFGDRNYGFISVEGEKDFFVARRDFQYSDYNEGDEVSFEATSTLKGFRATDVKLLKRVE